jgi:hypothetical protein
MKKHRYYFRTILLISILVGIFLPLALGVKDPIYIAISFSSVWIIYSLILFGYIFLVEGRRNRNRPNLQKEDSSLLYSMQEWEALWEITIGKNDPDEKKLLWS